MVNTVSWCSGSIRKALSGDFTYNIFTANPFQGRGAGSNPAGATILISYLQKV